MRIRVRVTARFKVRVRDSVRFQDGIKIRVRNGFLFRLLFMKGLE